MDDIQQTGDQLLVSACGRTCSVDTHHARSIADLQAALQRALQMNGQAFHICDINGTSLSTDMQVQDAIAQGLTPLSATIPIDSLHLLENRREELAQIQWKVVRDQMTQTNDQVTELTRQINDLRFQFQGLQREARGSVEDCRAETSKVIEHERSTTMAKIQPVQEAVNGAVLLIDRERNKHELALQGIEKQIHGVCDMIDDERSSRRKDLAGLMPFMKELKSTLDSEKRARNELEEEVMQIKRKNQKNQEDVSVTRSDKVSKVLFDTTSSEIMDRFTELEGRSVALESGLVEATERATGTLDHFLVRHEQVSQAVETMRQSLSAQSYDDSIANFSELMEEFKAKSLANELEIRNTVDKEKRNRDDHVRRAVQVSTNENAKQIAELEKKLGVRMERESAQREKNFQSMIDVITTNVEVRKFICDQSMVGMKSALDFIEDHVRRAVQASTNGNAKQIAELEEKIGIRMGCESAQREKSFQSTIDVVTTRVEDLQNKSIKMCELIKFMCVATEPIANNAVDLVQPVVVCKGNMPYRGSVTRSPDGSVSVPVRGASPERTTSAHGLTVTGPTYDTLAVGLPAKVLRTSNTPSSRSSFGSTQASLSPQPVSSVRMPAS